MLYLIQYFSIVVIFLIIITAFTSINTIVESREAFEESKKFIKMRNIVLSVLLVLVIVSSIGVKLVKNTYYTESILISENEIISIEKDDSKVICSYENENKEIESVKINLKNIDLTEFKAGEEFKIVKYETHTKSTISPTLFKILTFGHLPKETIAYVIEK